MTVWNALFLGLVQGITQLLPLSGTGHMAVLSNIFNMTAPQDGHAFFAVLLRLGTLAAVCVVYWRDIIAMPTELMSLAGLSGEDGQPRRYGAVKLLFMLVAASLPLFLVIPLYGRLELLCSKSIFIGLALVLSGCVLYIAGRMEPGKKSSAGMSIYDALIIGLCQCVAAIPGISHCGVTYTAGLATGLKREFAVKFAFLLSVPAVLGANMSDLAGAIRAGIDWGCFPAYLVGTAAAVVSGVAAINLFKSIVKNGKLGSLAYYLWLLGVLSIILSLIF